MLGFEREKNLVGWYARPRIPLVLPLELRCCIILLAKIVCVHSLTAREGNSSVPLPHFCCLKGLEGHSVGTLGVFLLPVWSGVHKKFN